MFNHHFYSLLFRALVGLALWLPLSAWAAGPVFVAIESTTQGLISEGAGSPESIGNLFMAGHEDEIYGLGFGHSVSLPLDPQSGQPTGQRIHKPLRIYKLFDKASPLLYQALVTGETLSRVELHFYRTNSVGALEHFYSITLQDAHLIDISSSVVSGTNGFQEREVLSITYGSITWENEIAGTVSSDDWRAPTP